MTNAEAWFNTASRPRKPESSLGRTAQDGHLDSQTAGLNYEPCENCRQRLHLQMTVIYCWCSVFWFLAVFNRCEICRFVYLLYSLFIFLRFLDVTISAINSCDKLSERQLEFRNGEKCEPHLPLCSSFQNGGRA